MANTLVIKITDSGNNLTQIANQIVDGGTIDATKPHEGMQKLINYLLAIDSKAIAASVDVSVTSATNAITTSGTGSTSGTYNLT